MKRAAKNYEIVGNKKKEVSRKYTPTQKHCLKRDGRLKINTKRERERERVWFENVANKTSFFLNDAI